MTPSTDLSTISPLVFDASWRRFKDATVNLISSRADLNNGEGDRLARVTRTLVDLDPDLSPSLPARVYELGVDLGRHVYAKDVTEDDLSQAIGSLAENVHVAGMGTLELRSSFHRRCVLAYQPSAKAKAAAPKLARLFVAGIVQGTLSEALNCEADLTLQPETITVELGQGRDANTEIRTR